MKPNIDWSKAPDWANFHVNDPDGQGWWFESCPNTYSLLGEWYEEFDDFEKSEINTDGNGWADSLVERPVTKQPVVVVDHDGWIRWDGGDCPVEAGTIIDVKYRDGFVATNIPAQEKSNWKDSRSAVRWEHYDFGTDIVAYRVSAPENKETKQELREKMTAAVLQGMLAGYGKYAREVSDSTLAEMAVALADAAIKELEKGRK